MPYASEFHQAALAFDDEAIEADGLHAPMSGALGPDVLTGGALTADVSALVNLAGLDNATNAGSLRELAEECRRRALLVESAAENYRLWNRAMTRHDISLSSWRADYQRWSDDPDAHAYPGSAPTAPPRPVPPHNWIEF